MKSCQVFFKGPVAFVFTQCTTTSGLGITTEPMFRAKHDAPAELGDVVMKCLAASRGNVPEPHDFPSLARNMVRFAGEKSWARFVNNAILREVWFDGTHARIVPFVPGERGSFDGRADQSIQCAYDPLEIARCLLQSISSDSIRHQDGQKHDDIYQL